MRRNKKKRTSKSVSNAPIVTTTAMKRRQGFQKVKKIGNVTVTIPTFGKSRSRSK